MTVLFGVLTIAAVTAAIGADAACKRGWISKRAANFWQMPMVTFGCVLIAVAVTT